MQINSRSCSRPLLHCREQQTNENRGRRKNESEEKELRLNRWIQPMMTLFFWTYTHSPLGNGRRIWMSVSQLFMFFFRQSQNALSDGWWLAMTSDRARWIDDGLCFLLSKFYVVERLLLSPRKSSHSRRLECVACSVERNDHGVDGIFDSSASTIARVERRREEKKKELMMINNRQPKTWNFCFHRVWMGAQKNQQLTTKKRDTYISCENWEYHSGKTMKFTSAMVTLARARTLYGWRKHTLMSILRSQPWVRRFPFFCFWETWNRYVGLCWHSFQNWGSLEKKIIKCALT